MVFEINTVMPKRIYPYVSNEFLVSEVTSILGSITSALETIDETLYSNVVDPFSALFDAAAQNITFDEWMAQERSRQLQKTFQNSIGYLHEHIIGNMAGWQNPAGSGYDLENVDRRIIAELKNKHNTMNSSSAEAVYTKMVEFLTTTKRGYTGYVVTIIPKSGARFNRTYNPSVRGISLPAREDLRLVDGATFYEIATGDRNALQKLYRALPIVIQGVLQRHGSEFKPEMERFNDLFSRAFS